MYNINMDSIKNITIITPNLKYKDASGGAFTRNFLINEWEKIGINVCAYNPPVILNDFTFYEILKGTLKVLFSKLRRDDCVIKSNILVTFDPYPIDVVTALRLSKKFNIPCVIYLHHIPPNILFHPFRRGIFRVILNRFYFRFLLALIQHYRVPIFLDNPNTGKGLNVKVYPDLVALNTTINVSNTNYKKYDICYVGGLGKHKGVEDIIYVLNILKNKYNINVKAVLVGKGRKKYVEKLIKKIKKYNLQNNVTLTGFVEEETKWQILSESKIFLFLSYEEGWSVSVMEAASLGIPIIAYDLPAYYYLGGNFFKVKPGDIKTVAQYIVNILENYEEALKIGTKAKESVKKFNQTFIAKQQLIFYKRIIEDYKRYVHR